MKTDFSGSGKSGWRKNSYPRTDVSTSDGMAGANFNALWKNPKSDDGSTDLQSAVRAAMKVDAPTVTSGDKFKAECVAWRYLSTLVNAFGTTKQANTTSVASTITGYSTGGTLINVYMCTIPQGNTPERNSLGIYQDWLAPYITTKGKTLQVGVPPKKSADDKRPKFTLPY